MNALTAQTKTGLIRTFDADLIRKQVDVTSNGCWEWRGWAKDNGLHVRIQFGTSKQYAHRISFQVFVGEIPLGLLVCHTCDNPPCVNPAHLYAGTWTDNRNDAIARGRTKPLRHIWGEAAPAARFPDSVVRAARECYATTDANIAEIAELFGPSEPVARKWVRGLLRPDAGGPITTHKPRTRRRNDTRNADAA